jgi:hypothetical protein
MRLKEHSTTNALASEALNLVRRAIEKLPFCRMARSNCGKSDFADLSFQIVLLSKSVSQPASLHPLPTRLQFHQLIVNAHYLTKLLKYK